MRGAVACECGSTPPLAYLEKPRYSEFVMFKVMKTMNATEPAHRAMGSTCVILFLCICVLAQMLGMPVTLFSLVTSSDVFLESVSEDFSFPPTVLNPRASNVRSPHAELLSSINLPVLITSVFHPPQV